MPKWVVILTGFLLVLFMTTAGAVISTEAHLRRYFGMPNYVGTVPEHVEAAILRQLPLGSSGTEVNGFLSSHGIGADGFSVCTGNPDTKRITCRMRPHHHSWELAREDCTVFFEFNDHHELNDVWVRSEFSVPRFY